MTTQQIENNTYTMSPANVANLSPLHSDTSRIKIEQLVSSMLANGWVGAPLVQCGGQLLNGTHRQAAVAIIGRDDYSFAIPIIDLTDAFDLDQDELDDLMANNNWVELTYICHCGDPATAEYLGLDCH